MIGQTAVYVNASSFTCIIYMPVHIVSIGPMFELNSCSMTPVDECRHCGGRPKQSVTEQLLHGNV